MTETDKTMWEGLPITWDAKTVTIHSPDLAELMEKTKNLDPRNYSPDKIRQLLRVNIESAMSLDAEMIAGYIKEREERDR